MDNSLDNILNGTSVDEQVAEPVVETPAVPVEAAPEAPATPDRPRDEHGRFLPKGDNEPELAVEAAPAVSASPAPEDAKPELEHPALIGERRRRQTAEAERDEFKRQLAQVALPQVPQVAQPVPDQWDDPDGWAAHVRAEATRAATEAAVGEVRRERVKLSAEAAKVKFPDYMEKVPVFEALAQDNPVLWDRMFQHPDPAGYAYSIVKDHEEMSQYGSLEARDAAMKAKWEASALEALKAALPAQSAPPTLSNERNVGSRAGPDWSGPKSLGDILAT